MRFAYPATLTPAEEGGYVVTFPDVPEAITEGDTRKQALGHAADALLAALGIYISEHRDLPVPSRPGRARPAVLLPPLAAAKLALYQALMEAGTTRVALAGRLGVSEGAVRRLLDLDHRSHIGQVEAALAVLGKRLVVEAQDAA